MTDLSIPDSANEITPEWLSAVLEAPVTGVQLEPVTTGFTSTTIRARVAFERPQPDLPGTLIVKLPHRDLKIRAFIEAWGLYACEAAFYRDLGTHFEEAIPRCFHAVHDPVAVRSAIVLEDCVTSRGLHVGDNLQGCSWDEAAAAIGALASWHARWWNNPDLTCLAWLPTHASQSPDIVRKLTDKWARVPPKLRALMSKGLSETLNLFCPRALLVTTRTSGAPWTLTHGDYRLDNLLFGPGSEVVAFDWQFVARGQGARDATYFARSIVDDRPIEETWPALLEVYYRTLAESGIRYSAEAFARDVRVNALHNLRMVVTALPNIDFSSERARSFARLAQLAIGRWNVLAELLDLPGLLREEFPLP